MRLLRANAPRLQPVKSFATADDRHESKIVAQSRCSSQCNTSDSSPVSSTFDISSRHRMSSSTSSVSSSPPHETQESTVWNKKSSPVALPNLEEHPMEIEGQHEVLDLTDTAGFHYYSKRWSQDGTGCRPSSSSSTSFDCGLRNGFASDVEEPFSKRRRSGDSAWVNFTSRIPSVTKRARQHRRAASSINEVNHNFFPPRLGSSSPTFMSRSNSQNRSFRHQSGGSDRADSLEPQLSPNQIETIMECDSTAPGVSEVEYSYQDDVQPLDETEHEPRTHTPMLSLGRGNEAPIDLGSPLQSPTVASNDDQYSTSHTTPADTPCLSARNSPPLSTKPSDSSFSRSRSATMNGTTPPDVPPSLISDTNDEWADRLGHANFQITPSPYLPAYCTTQACKQFYRDWKTARGEFARQLARTATHFGANSRIYRMTEEKLSEIDSQWKCYAEVASQRAAELGEQPTDLFAMNNEPAPYAKIPPIDDPRLVQNEEIVEAMDKIDGHMNRRPSKRAQLMKMFSGYKLPNTLLGSRSASTSSTTGGPY